MKARSLLGLALGSVAMAACGTAGEGGDDRVAALGVALEPQPPNDADCVVREPATLTPAPWTMHRAEGIVRFKRKAKAHGELAEFAGVNIPSAADSGWKPAPDPLNVAFAERSVLCGSRVACLAGGNFTHFQTALTVPSDVIVDAAALRLAGIDDGVRTTLFNQAYPGGISIPGGHVQLGQSATVNLGPLLRTGDNRIVVTHVDDCCSESFLRQATVTAAGTRLVPSPNAVDDGNPCTTDHCDPHLGAVHEPVPDGTSCDDADVCNGTEQCASGVCASGTPPVVDDGDPCTNDRCDSMAGVVHEPRPVGSTCDAEVACSDGAPFQVNATGAIDLGRRAFAALGAPVTVFDWSSFFPIGAHQHGTLHPLLQARQLDAVGSDGLASRVSGHFDVMNWLDGPGFDGADGQAVADLAISGVEFRFDFARPIHALGFPIATGPGNAPDEVDLLGATFELSALDATGDSVGTATVELEAGHRAQIWVSLTSGTPFVSLLVEEIGALSISDQYLGNLIATDCAEPNLCALSPTCDDRGACVSEPVAVVDDGNPCTLDECHPNAGAVHTPIPGGTPCDDGDACNGTESCDDLGVCQSGTPPLLDDGNPCTADACDAAGGVSHSNAPPGTACADGNACNGAERCDGTGTCIAGAPLATDDGNPCTLDSCDPLIGTVHEPAPFGTSCADANECDGHESCDGGGNCLDASTNVAQVDWTDWTTQGNGAVAGLAGEVGVSYTGQLSPGAILSGSENYWVSNPSTYASPPEVDNPPVLPDIIRMSGGNADVMTVRFSHSVVNPVMAIVSLGQSGSGARFEFIDAPFRILKNGPGYWGNGPLSELPGNVLHGNEGHGLIQFEGAFDEIRWRAPLYEYWYGFNVGVHATSPVTLAVDDGNPCTADLCDPALGVTHQPLPVGTSCDDDSVCNGTETCDGTGSCQPGAPLAVDDANPCTVDSCDPLAGIVHLNAVDGTPCSLSGCGNERCFEGECVGGVATTTRLAFRGQATHGGPGNQFGQGITLSSSGPVVAAYDAASFGFVLELGSDIRSASRRAELPEARFAHDLVAVGQSLLVAGGNASQTRGVLSIVDQGTFGVTSHIPEFFGYGGYEYFSGIAATDTEDGDVIAVGVSEPCFRQHQYVLARYNESGELLALGSAPNVSIAAPPCSGQTHALGVDVSDGDVYIAVSENGASPLLARHASDLLHVWSARAAGTVGAYAAVDATLEGVFAAGSIQNNGRSNYIVSKFDLAGNEIWRRTGDPSVTQGLAGVKILDGVVYAVGTIETDDERGLDAQLVAIDAETGIVLQRETFGGTNADSAHDLVIRDNQLFVSGSSSSFAGGGNEVGSSDVLVLEYSVERSCVNQPPLVDAGADQQVPSHTSVVVTGLATDDGLPVGSSLAVWWLQASGPGAVEFADPSLVSTTATFSTPGTYVLRLEATDSELTAFDEITITVAASDCEPAPSDLIAWWPADGDALDAIGDLDGELLNGAGFGSGRVGQGFTFDGVDDRVDVPSSTAFSSSGPYTWEFWFRHEIGSLATDQRSPLFLSKGSVDSLGIANADETDPIGLPNGRFEVRGPTPRAWGTTNSWEGQRWRHAAVTFDGTQYVVYVDGAEEAAVVAGRSILANSSTLSFGCDSGLGALSCFRGDVDELSLYGRVLSGTEVSSLFRGGQSGKCNDANRAPGVDAGPDAVVNVSEVVTLSGTTGDDGEPSGELSSMWSSSVGPGAITLGNATSPTTTATGASVGGHVLELSASDGELSAKDDMLLCLATPNSRYVNDFENDLIDRFRPWSTGCCQGGVVGEANGVFFTGFGTAPAPSSEHKFYATPERFSPLGEGVAARARIRFSGDYQEFGFGRETRNFFNRPGDIFIRFYTGQRPADPEHQVFLHVSSVDKTGAWRDVYLQPVPLTRYEFHEFKLEWRPTSAHFFIDGALVGESRIPVGCNQDLTIGNARSQLMETDWVEVHAIGAPTNAPPIVNAGADGTVTLPSGVILTATVTDDAQPAGTLAQTWTQVAGPAAASIASSASTTTAVSFEQAGSYTFRLTANDGELSGRDEVVITVLPPVDVNQPPLVNAGLDATVPVNQPLALGGTVVDDGRPAGGTLTTNWSRVSGPGIATFTDPVSPVTTVTFSATGTHVLRLTANDGELSAFDEITVTATPAVNQAPVVNAGADRTVTEDQGVLFEGSYADDGLPEGGTTSVQWGYVTAPTPPRIDDNTQTTLDVLFPEPGLYELILIVNDGELDGFDTVLVEVLPRVNQAPAVSAGPDLSATYPGAAALQATVTDDGLPEGSSLTVAWSQVGGTPGVSFTNPSATATTASFPGAGTFILRVTASDGAFSVSDDIEVIVNPAAPNQAPVANAGPDLEIQLPTTSVSLGGVVTDDGLPAGVPLAVNWSFVSGPTAPVIADPAHATTLVTFSTPGEYSFRLTANDSEFTAADEVTVVVWGSGGEAPEIALSAPADSAAITGLTAVIGTVSDTDLVEWYLEHRAMDGQEWTRFAGGTSPVGGGTLGTFDPTLLENGIYEIRLTATDRSRQFVSTSITATLEGNQKVGNFSVAFKDLEVPVAGIPIQVIRTYDSRNKRRGDFGFGWTLDIKSVKVHENRAPGALWQGNVECGDAFCITRRYCITEQRPHIVAVLFADGKLFKFRVAISPSCQAAPPSTVNVTFTPMPGTTASLAVIGGNSALVDGSFVEDELTEIALRNQENAEFFDPSRYVLTLQDGRELRLDQATGLEQVRDTNGNVLEVRPTGLTHSSGKSVTFTRDALGRITAVTDPSGNTLEYGYDSRGDLVSFTDLADQVSRYEYDARHLLLGIEDPRGIEPLRNEYDDAGRLLAHTDAFGNEIQYQHDLVARSEVVTDRLGNSTTHEYDERGNVLRTLDALGNATRYTYDERDNELSQCNAQNECTSATYDASDNKVTETDALGHITRYSYDARGNVLTTIDALGRVTSNGYDSRGNLTTTSDAAGNVTSYEYDGRGLQTSMTDALGNVTSYEYDASGNLTREVDPTGHATTYTYDSNGNRTSQSTTRTTASGVETLVTTFGYDAANRLILTTNPDGSTVATEYDAIGQQTATVDALGRRTTRTFDEMGRALSTTYPDGTTETTAYDAEGRRVESRDRANRLTTFEYDAVGRLVRTVFPDGTSTSTSYDAAGRTASSTDEAGSVTSFEYDAAGRRTHATDPLGNVTEFTYDAAGNQVTMTDARGNVTGYVYDAINRRAEVLFADGTLETTEYDNLGRRSAKVDQAGIRTEYGYDAQGRLTSVTDALGGITSYAYDELGNQLTQVDALGHTTRFAYDTMGRRTRRTLPAVAPATSGAFETMTYDPAGNLITKTDFRGRSITFAYDLSNRLIAKAYPDGSTHTFSYTASGRRATATDSRGVTSYTYDARDRVTSLTYPDGRQLEYAYDARGARTLLRARVGATTLATAYTHDAAGRPATVSDPNGGSYTYKHDENGNRTEIAQPNGTRTTYTYDSLNRLTDLTTARTNGSIVQSYAYTLGATGVRTQIAEAGGVNRSYTYDALYRLTGETITGSSTDYTKTFIYDAVGNRQRQTTTGFDAALVNYTYDERDRLLTENATASTWDDNGNLTSRADDAEYTWDVDDRLVRVTKADGTVVEHAYDVDGVRVRTRTLAAGGTEEITEYLVDTTGALSHVVAETDGAGALTAYYVRGGDQLLAVLGGGEARYYHADGLGSVRALTDATGGVTDVYGYTAFGEALGWTGDEEQPYRFAGEAWEQSTGQIFLRARRIAPSTGRFTSSDPFPGRQYYPGSRHKYLFVENRPTTSVDPTGLFTIADVSITNAILGNLRTSLPVRAALATMRLADRAAAMGQALRATREIFNPKVKVGGVAWFWDFETGTTVEINLGFGVGQSPDELGVTVVQQGGPRQTQVTVSLLCEVSPGKIHGCSYGGGLTWEKEVWRRGFAHVDFGMEARLNAIGVGDVEDELTMTLSAGVGVATVLSFEFNVFDILFRIADR